MYSHPPLKKLIMELKIAFLIILVSISNVFATPTYSQVAKVSLDMENKSLEQVMDKIESQSEFYFIFNQKQIDINRVVSIQVENKLITDILPELFKGTNVNYAIFNRKILLTTDPLEDNLIAIASGIEPQQKQITGTVTDKNGKPLPGVNVVVTGTTLGVITDNAGKYSIEVPKGAKSLTFSFIGMQSQEITIGTLTQIDVIMVESAIGLEEVVVIGYGATKKSDLTGSVISMNSKELEATMNTNLSLTIQGAIPGLNVTSSSFNPGSEQIIRIRGENSLSASNNPLIILDGFTFEGNMNEINTADVESISVLKDASSSAIYGARAANGVIIITTKKGQKGKTKISYNGRYGIQSVQNKIDLIDDGDRFITLLQDVHRWRKDVVSLAPLDLLFSNEIPQYNAGTTTNWQDLVLRIAPEQEHIVSISGANDRTSYYSSLGLLDQEGVVVNSGFKRYTLRTNVQHNINNWLKLGSNLQFTYSDYGGVMPNLDNAIRMSPYGKLKEDNGEYTFYPTFPETFYTNPFANDNATNNDIRRSSTANLFAEISPAYIPGLSYQLNLGIYFNDSKAGNYYPSTSLSGLQTDGLAKISYQNRFHWTVENILNYQKKFGRHQIKFTGLYSREGSKYETSYLEGKGFINDLNLYHYMASAEQKNISSSLTETSLESLMGRINYDFDDRYFLTLTARRDGYSGFGKNNKYGFFPSAALGWSISKENFFMKSSTLRFINFLKLRLSYGVNGNMAIDPYKTLDSFTTVYTVFGDNATTVNGVINSVIGNPDLKWEGTEKFNIGLDFATLKNRISGTIDIYKSNSHDLLMARQVPIMNGYTSIWYNIGKTENKGIEVILNSLNITKGDFEWSSSLNFSLNRDKIISLREGNVDDIANKWFIGKPLRVYYDYNVIGVWQLDDDIADSHMPSAKPGDPIFEDVNKDGKLTPDDRKIIDSQLPNWIAGMTNTIAYKNWSLSVFINTVQGIHKPNTLIDPTTWLNRKNTTFVDVPYWTPDRPSNEYVTPGYDSNESFGLTHNFYQNANFVRIKELTLSYNLPKRLNQFLGLNNLKLYLKSENLYTFTSWIGYDPETSSSFGAYPSARLISIGAKIDF